jgi:hypothetical protein
MLVLPSVAIALSLLVDVSTFSFPSPAAEFVIVV